MAERRPADADRVATPDAPAPEHRAGASQESREDRASARSAGNRYVAQLLARGPGNGPAKRAAVTPNRPVINRTGLPDRLKSGLEQLGGVPLDDVRVHYDSPEPQRLGALAFTRGSDIHVGAGQRVHLAHEGWHVVQQKQGRVRRTRWLDDVPVNDDAALEAEADRAGGRAQSHAVPVTHAAAGGRAQSHPETVAQAAAGGGTGPVARRSELGGVVQGVWADQGAMAERGLDPKAGVAQALQALAAFVDAGGGKLEAEEKAALLYVVQNRLDQDAAIGPRLRAFLEPTLGEGSVWTSEQLVRGVIKAAEDPEEDEEDESDESGSDVADLKPEDVAWGDFDASNPRELQILQDLFVHQMLNGAPRADELRPYDAERLFAKWYRSGVWTRQQLRREIADMLDRHSGGGPVKKPSRSGRYDPYARPESMSRPGREVQMTWAGDEIVQRLPLPNTLSFKPKYKTSNFGTFLNVGYMRDAQANVGFPVAQASVGQVWTNPTWPGSMINLAKGSANPKRGLKSATQSLKIAPNGTRPDHFEIANYLTGLNPGGNARSSPPDKTWHHLTVAGYFMHLVDRKVHQKHCHLGGMYFWR